MHPRERIGGFLNRKETNSMQLKIVDYTKNKQFNWKWNLRHYQRSMVSLTEKLPKTIRLFPIFMQFVFVFVRWHLTIWWNAFPFWFSFLFQYLVPKNCAIRKFIFSSVRVRFVLAIDKQKMKDFFSFIIISTFRCIVSSINDRMRIRLQLKSNSFHFVNFLSFIKQKKKKFRFSFS